MSVALRLVDDDGLPHELQRLRRDLEIRAQALQTAYEDAAIKDEVIRKQHREIIGLKARITRQEREERNVNHELVVAVIDFWRALRRNQRLTRGPKRAGAILARLKDDPPAQPKDFIYPTLGIVLSPVPKKSGTEFHDDIYTALSDEGQVYKWMKIGREALGGRPPREVIEELGGREALEALDRLLELQGRWAVKADRRQRKEAAA